MIEIHSKSLVPLVQGTLRYAYKCDPAAGNEGDKACAEGWAFASALLPALDNCDSTAAATVVTQMKLQNAASSSDMTGMLPGGFATVKSAIEDQYDCMDITCDDVGGLIETSDPLAYYSGMSPCETLSPASRAAPMAFT